MTKLMLALVTEAYGGSGGIAQYNRDLLEALAGGATNLDAIVVLPRLSSGHLQSLASPIRQQPANPSKIRYALNALRQAIALRPAVVFCGHLFMAPLARLAARLANARLVVQLHGIEIWRPPTPSQRRALEAADMVLCVSRNTRDWACKWASLLPERAIVIANTVAGDFLPGDRSAARARFGLSDDEFAIVSVGRLDAREQYKGHDRVLAALSGPAECAERNIRYLIAGDGDDRPRLEALAKSHGISDRTSFLGQVDRSVLPDLYRAADLFALPSLGEGFGIVFLEAMASGTPAIGLAAGGASDALGDGELGVCVSESDFPKALSRAVVSAAPRPSRLAEEVRSRFGSQIFRQRVSAAFERLAA